MVKNLKLISLFCLLFFVGVTLQAQTVMTGTAKTEEEEFRNIYNMYVIEIPTNKPVIRIDAPDIVYATKEAKYKAIIEKVKELYDKGQPVLIGTIAIETSELISGMLDKAGIPYEWRIFTNDSLPIPNENVIYMKPRLDIRNYIADADYLVQLSDTEAFSYSILESLCLGTPVIITPIPSSIEMGVKNGINGYILDFSMQDIPINDIYTKVPKFTFKSPKDIYDKLLIDEPTTYKPEKLVQCRALKTYNDVEFKERIIKGKLLPSKITLSRAEELINDSRGALVEICE